MVSSTVVNSSEFAAAKSLQSCPTLCDPRDRSQPGSPLPWILQARTLEWVAIPSPKGTIERKRVKSLSCVRLFVTPRSIAYQASPSMEFSKQEYWSGLPFPSPGDLPDPEIEPGSHTLLADSLPSEPPRNPHPWAGAMLIIVSVLVPVLKKPKARGI